MKFLTEPSSAVSEFSHMRVALFTGNYHSVRDGVALTLHRLVTFLRDRNIASMVFGPACDKPVLEPVGTYVGVPAIGIPGRPEYRLALGLPTDALEKLRVFRPTLLHLATPDLLGLRALAYAQQNNLVCVGSYHTHFTGYLKYFNLDMFQGLGWSYLNWFYSQCRHTYVPTSSMMEELTRHGITNGLRIWSRGVDCDLFTPSRRSPAWRRQHGFAETDCVVTFVSRLVWEKDLATLAETARVVSASHSQVKFLIVGDGPARQDLERLMPQATFIGFQTGEALAAAYASSDLFFFPSETETFGNVTLEAMASGLPVVAARAPGSSSLIEHGMNGFFSPARQIPTFVRHIIQLADQADLRRRMGQTARETATIRRWEDVLMQLLGYYDEAIADAAHERSVA